MFLIIREFFAKVQITISNDEIYFTKGKFNKTRKWKNRLKS
jgi:hypothetical protein